MPHQRTDGGTGSNGSRRIAISTAAKIGIKNPCEYWGLVQAFTNPSIVFQYAHTVTKQSPPMMYQGVN
jgi:hypothetical protein